jgi:hypothetical protein
MLFPQGEATVKKTSSADKRKASPKAATKKKRSRKRASATARRKPVMRFSREGQSKD